jgi:hypothetical protein
MLSDGSECCWGGQQKREWTMDNQIRLRFRLTACFITVLLTAVMAFARHSSNPTFHLVGQVIEYVGMVVLVGLVSWFCISSIRRIFFPTF